MALKDNNTIQGLVGNKNDKDSHAVYLHWACSAPYNNKYEYGSNNPAAIVEPAMAATLASTMAVVYCKVMEGKRRI